MIETEVRKPVRINHLLAGNYMHKNYVYRMDHDTGFAPNIQDNICTLSGCKKDTIEKWASQGSWIIGIGGKRTGKPDKLIYVMIVDERLSHSDFISKYPDRSQYLKGKQTNSVLVSREFYYFGDKAIELPQELENINIDR